MSKFVVSTLFVVFLHAVFRLQVAVEAAEPNSATLYPAVQSYLDQRRAEFDQIPAERKSQLQKIALYITSRAKAGQTSKLTFICTHNSRRSHMSQIWSAVAASDLKVAGVETFSGGTEATAFNPRAVAAIERAGLKVEKMDDTKNPKYAVRLGTAGQTLICFSKVYGDPPNPKDDFCAVMTCSQADKICPTVNGCSLRVAIPFDDPKTSDNTPEEASKYDERSAQISREMLYLFSQVGN
jgi:arsenate reductase